MAAATHFGGVAAAVPKARRGAVSRSRNGEQCSRSHPFQLDTARERYLKSQTILSPLSSRLVSSPLLAARTRNDAGCNKRSYPISWILSLPPAAPRINNLFFCSCLSSPLLSSLLRSCPPLSPLLAHTHTPIRFSLILSSPLLSSPTSLISHLSLPSHPPPRPLQSPPCVPPSRTNPKPPRPPLRRTRASWRWRWTRCAWRPRYAPR